jgi:hypothetical protein
MSSYTLLKSATSLVAGIGASKIIKEIIVHNTHAPETVINRVLMAAGTIGMGAVASDLVQTAVHREMDEVKGVVDKFRSGEYSKKIAENSEKVREAKDAALTAVAEKQADDKS